MGRMSLRRHTRGSIWIAGAALALGCSSSPVAGYQPWADAGGEAAAGDVGATDAASDAAPEAGAAGCTTLSCGGGLVCDTATQFCRGCASDAECAALGSIDSACIAGQCSVPCATNADCASDPLGSVCDGGGCRPCLNDAECTVGAGICLDTQGGLCARSDQAVFVEFATGGCPNADGSATHPYCTPNAALAALPSGAEALIIRGPVNDPITIAANLDGLLIVGAPNAAGTPASIPAGAGTAILASNGYDDVRDLAIVGGTAATSIGIAVTGASTYLGLTRVTVALGTGIGVEVDGGGRVGMTACLVQDNSVAGLRIDGGSYSVDNSIFATNGIGIDFTATPIPFPPPSDIGFVTVVDNVQDAVRCDPANAQTLTGSIVAGTNGSCILDNSLTTAPTFDPARPYHLTASFPCPDGAPDSYPLDDIDGDPRTVPVDCGADQFVAAP